MQFGRYPEEETQSKKPLPEEWTEALTKTLTETYFEQSEKDNCFFDVYGEIYNKDFVVIVSYLHHDDPMLSPISIFLSHDIVDESKEFKKVLNSLVDLTGLILDDIFSTEDWNEYNSNWTENEFKGSNFFYKITRENISLTLQAEELLKKDSPL